MCGVTGFLMAPIRTEGELKETAEKMSNAIAHRGPDDANAWADAQAGIALGHRRLAIIDLSLAGRQPMTSSSGRFVVAFNGEVYNHLNIRAELLADGAALSVCCSLCVNDFGSAVNLRGNHQKPFVYFYPVIFHH